MKKRNFIISAFFVLLFFVLCLTGCKAECIETNFDCNNDVGCALFCSNQKGLKCSGDCIDCEWYPMYFGIGYDDCLSPVICGFSICDGAPFDSQSFKSAIPNNATNLPITSTTSEIKEKEDYVISSISYILKNAHGETYEAVSFDDLIHSDLYTEICDASYREQLNALENSWTFSISVKIVIQAKQEMEVTAETVLSTAIYESIMDRTNGTKYSQKEKLNKGTNTIYINMNDIDYIEATMNQEIGEIKISGTKRLFALGGE